MWMLIEYFPTELQISLIIAPLSVKLASYDYVRTKKSLIIAPLSVKLASFKIVSLPRRPTVYWLILSLSK